MDTLSLANKTSITVGFDLLVQLYGFDTIPKTGKNRAHAETNKPNFVPIFRIIHNVYTNANITRYVIFHIDG